MSGPLSYEVLRYAPLTWTFLAFLAWGVTGYSVWRKERERVLALHGRPVVVVSIRVAGSPVDPHHLIGVTNASGDVATNVTISRVAIKGSVGLEFNSLPSLAQSPAPTWIDYTVTGLGVFTSRELWHVFEALNVDSFSTTLEFSNFGNSRRWGLQCKFYWDFVTKELRCSLGDVHPIQI